MTLKAMKSATKAAWSMKTEPILAIPFHWTLFPRPRAMRAQRLNCLTCSAARKKPP